MNNRDSSSDKYIIQVFGQKELEQHLKKGQFHHTHLVSIGNPHLYFHPRMEDCSMPDLFNKSFEKILRLAFFDVECKKHLRKDMHPKRIPRHRDIKKMISFYKETRNEASGYTIHCWQGVSRSAAVALGYLYMITGSEKKAAEILRKIRPESYPNQLIIKYFDRELDSNITACAEEIRRKRLKEWKTELDLCADDLLEELPGED